MSAKMRRQSGQPKSDSATKGCYVYMVVASDGSIYTGISGDPERRVTEHNEGKRGAKALRSKRPVRLLRHWLCEDRSTALRLEAEIKKLRAPEKWSIILGNDSDQELPPCRNASSRGPSDQPIRDNAKPMPSGSLLP